MSASKHHPGHPRRRSRLAAVGVLLLTAVGSVVATAPQAAFAASTISQWNFNSSPADASTGTGSSAPSTGAGTIAMVGGATNPSFNSGAGSSDLGADNSGYQTSSYAAQGAEDKARGVQFNVSTAGQQDILVSWDQRHSNTSSRWVQFQYSADGTTFTDFGSPYEATGGDLWFNNRTADLSAITAVDDNPNFAFRIVSTFAPTTVAYAPSNPLNTYATTGTWRFDMVTVSGDPVGSTLPTLSIDDVTRDEGDGGTTTFTFTTSLSAPAPAGGVTFDIATADGTATTADIDYVSSSLTAQTIPSGSSSATFDVTVNGDTTIEPTEAFSVNLTNVVGATLLDGQGTGTITTDDLAPPPATTIDLSTYQRIGRYDLPVAARVTAPVGSELALEVSAVTYHPTRDTLFVLGDEGTSVVQVAKNGQIIDSMTLTLGDFDDPEGLTFAGTGDQFVIVEERQRRVNLFTYVGGGTLSRVDVQSVVLGTTVGNIGLEGITLDPQTGGYVLVKETSPQGVFQTGVDFGAGTATNGSPSTVNSTDLFDPALLALGDIADVYALSNLPAPLTDDNLLVLSQVDGRIVNVDRTGAISNSLTITGDADNPLTVTTQGFEGVTMDAAGLLYVVGEQAGGSNHPQVWVYAPATFVYTNAAPVDVSVANATASLPESTSTAAAVRVGTVVVSDDALGTNVISVTGADAAAFEIQGTGLFVKAGTALDFETKTTYTVTVQVDDATAGATPDAARSFTLEITDITEAPPALIVTEVAPWSSGNSPGVLADWFEVTNTSTSAVDITGWKMDDSSASFATSVALNSVTSIGPGQSAIFVEGDATKVTAFIATWFGGVTPSDVLFGTYTGSGVGLGTGGDAVNLYSSTGAFVTGASFGASPTASPFATFDNAARNATVTTLSVAGTNGAFSVVDGAVTLIGSPGTTVTTTRIRTIQGAGHRSPLVGQSVTGVSGLVTARASNGFYLQDPQSDADVATSEAIFVFTNSAPTVAVGDAVRVSGTVSEFRPANNANNLTITQIGSPVITVVSTGNTLPSPIVIGAAGRVPPSQVINDEAGNVESAGSFDAATDGIDFYESLEAMRVQIDQPVAVSPTNRFREVWVLSEGGAGASVRTERGGIVIRSNDFNPERIQIDDRLLANSTPTVDVGASLSTAVGVVSFEFSNYDVLLTSPVTVAAPSMLARESTTLVGDATNLTVATFNVENLDPSDGATKFDELAAGIVSNLGSPDIVGLEEIQDNNGSTNDSVVDATLTYQTLIDAIVAAGGPTYEFRQINPVDDTNGGEPGGNIRVGFLVNTNRVTFVDRPGGTPTAATTVTDLSGQPRISASPGLIDPTNAAFNSSRKPLVGEFVFNGQTVFLIVNHWNSKGGDQPLFGPNQPPTLGSEVQRTQQATIVRDFVQSILTIDANARVAVIGDLNDFEFSNPLTVLEGAGLTPLIETLPENQRYTYNFEGNAQALDHIVVSGGLLSALAGYDVVHMNSEFATQVSDHDPQVAQFTIALPNRVPVADGQSVTTAEDTSTAITLTANDPDGDTLTYTVVDGPTNGTLSGIAPNLTYTPGADFSGTDTFTFIANDGTVDSNVATVSITVTATNDAPVANAQSVSTSEDTSTAITLEANDPDGDTLTYTVVDGPTNGTLSGIAPNLTYTPGADFSGTDTFTFIANDGTVDSDVATVSITVNATNDAPTIAYLPTSPTCSVTGARVAFGVTVADIDAGGTLTVSATSTSNLITPSVNGTSVTIAISGKQSVSGTVTVRVTDAGGLSASFTINVIAGDSQGNTLVGTDGIDFLFGLGGGDFLAGLGSSDVLCGGAGADSLAGGDGDDTLDGGQGNDRLFGDAGNDRLFGGDGRDVLTGGADVDAFDGGLGTDIAADRVAGEPRVRVP